MDHPETARPPEARRPETENPERACPEPAAVVLLSGGLDSATVLAMARARGLRCTTLAFDYGQRHRHELDAARAVSEHLGAREHRVASIDLRAIGGSALTDDAIDVPRHASADEVSSDIPVTYVPARNLIFLSFAVAHAEVAGASGIHIGVNAVDYSGYPDCRPEFIASFASTANLATPRRGAGLGAGDLHAPDRHDQGPDHPRGRGTGRGLRDDALVLRPRGRARLRVVRFVPAPQAWVRASRRAGRDPVTPGRFRICCQLPSTSSISRSTAMSSFSLVT